MQSQEHRSLGAVRKTHVGSEILLCRAAPDGLWESVPLIWTPAQSEWYCGAPNANLGENCGGSKEGTRLSTWTLERNPSLLPHIPWSYQNLASFPQNEYVHSIKCIMPCVRDCHHLHTNRSGDRSV